MINYSNGKIYKITSIHTDLVYIGSTTQLLCKRLAGHVVHYKRYLNGKFRRVTSFEIIKLGDYKIELVEKYPCNDKEELLAREGEVIKNTPNCVNKIIVGRTQMQYRADNKKEIAEKHKQYRADNKNEIAEKKKQYYDVNKEEIAEKKKQHYDANKEAINEKKKQQFECQCGTNVRISDKARHERSKKHQEFIKNQ